MPKIVVLLTSDQFDDADDIPMYENAVNGHGTTFYWGADEDSPGGTEIRVWAMFSDIVTSEEAFSMVRERLG